MKTKYKRKKYDFGTQQVIVPEKGNAGDVGQSAIALGAAGATLGSVAGPWGTVIGGAAGALTGVGVGLAKAGEKTRLHNQAIGANNYIRTMNRTDNPQLESFQAKKGLDYSKYPDGTSGIKLQPDEIARLDSLKSDPNAYRTSLWNMMGYSPKKYPAGSDGWKQQNDMYNSAVGYINQGFRPFTKENNGKTVSGYTKLYENGTHDIETNDGVKPIEVEKDELVFSRSGRNYKLRADFKGGKTHEQGGEPFVAQEGDVIYPGKDRNRVMKAYNRGDFAALESMRLRLPKDVSKAANGLDNDPIDNAYGQSFDMTGYKGTNYYNTENKLYTKRYKNAPVQSSENLNEDPKLQAQIRPNVDESNSMVDEGGNIKPSSSTGNGINAAAGIVQAAPTIYNTARGVFAKSQQPARRFYTPEKYLYSDQSDPNRRASREQLTVDKANANAVASSRGQATSYLSQAGINNYKRLSDINNYETGRKYDINNMNTQQSNQAGLTNLELANQYDNQALQNEAKRTEYLGNAVEGASKLAYNRELTDNMKDRDKTLMGLARTQHYGYEEGVGSGYYAPDGTFISGGKTYKNGKVIYKKGTKYIRTK